MVNKKHKPNSKKIKSELIQIMYSKKNIKIYNNFNTMIDLSDLRKIWQLN